MHIKYTKIHIGRRILKTATAVIIAMGIVNPYGATTSKIIFAVLGAMAAMEPTFKESLESCLTQIVGVFFGALAGVLLLTLPLPSLVVTGIGIVLVITSYNALNIRFSPSLPCLIVVTLCTTPDIQPLSYAIGRFWDTAIGLGVGILINTLVLPYDNSRQIRDTAESLAQETLLILKNMFDGDKVLLDAEKIVQIVDDMENQLVIFSNQWHLLRLKRYSQQYEAFQICERKARKLVVQIGVLYQMEHPGRLNEENCKRLIDCGVNIHEQRPIDAMQEVDIVTNYHVDQLLTLRQELLDALEK